MIEEASVPTETSGLRSIGRILSRVALVAGALAISGYVLLKAFDDLDLAAVGSAIRSLSDAEMLALGSMWLLWIGAQGLLTASLIKGLPVRRGVVAFLGPAALTSVLPGPSDLPVRFRMLTSWGRDRADATLAVAAGGVFSIGIKLLMPVIAAIVLLSGGDAIEGALLTGIRVALLLGVCILVIGVVVGSARRTGWVGRRLDPIWRAVLRLLRRPGREDLGVRLVAIRERAVETLQGRWLIATWATTLTAGARFALLLMAVRFTGVPEEALGWIEVFVAYAVVQGLTVLPLTPGDAGVSELVLISLMTASAGSEWVNAVTAGVVVFRVLTWVLIIPIGLLTLAIWQHSIRRKTRRPVAIVEPEPEPEPAPEPEPEPEPDRQPGH